MKIIHAGVLGDTGNVHSPFSLGFVTVGGGANRI
jgi:hypothetical protein